MGNSMTTKKGLIGLIIAVVMSFCIAGGMTLTAFAQPAGGSQNLAVGIAQLTEQGTGDTGSADTYTVTITVSSNDPNVTLERGLAKQTVTKGQEIQDVTYTTATGYIFSNDASDYFTKQGITVTRTDDTTVTVSGTPTADVDIEVPFAITDPAVQYCYYKADTDGTTPTLHTDGTRRDCNTVGYGTYVLTPDEGKSEAWYVVKKDTTIKSYRVNVSGTVNLILCDGATLTVEKGMRVSSGSTLNIYGQQGNTGKLIAMSAVGSNNAAIGGNDQGNGGTIVIHGGSVTAVGDGGGAGIGGGAKGTTGKDGGAVTIYGGTVNACGGKDANGIGAGNGGTVDNALTLGSGVTMFVSEDGDTWSQLDSGSDTRKRYMSTANHGESAATHTVTLTGGTNATPSGATTQKVAQGQPMFSVAYTANDGYYFADFEDITNNGVKAEKTDITVVAVSGIPSDDATIAIPDATPLPDNVYAVIKAIRGLPEPEAVTTANKDSIKAARAAYDALSENNQELVGDLDDKLERDEIALVKALINALADPKNVTLDDKTAIEEAREAYTALTGWQKDMVGDEALAKLNAAEQALKTAQDAAAPDNTDGNGNADNNDNADNTDNTDNTDNAKPTYSSVGADAASWTRGSSDPLTFTFKRAVNDETTFDHFTGISVDGATVPEYDAAGNVNYTATPGSVVVALQPTFLESLSVGKHEITANFNDGTASAAFTVQAAPADAKAAAKAATKSTASNTSATKTGDNLPVIAVVVVAVIAVAALVALLVARRKGQK